MQINNLFPILVETNEPQDQLINLLGDSICEICHANFLLPTQGKLVCRKEKSGDTYSYYCNYCYDIMSIVGFYLFKNGKLRMKSGGLIIQIQK